ncbi:hypothetical protein DL96DRAFT_820627 [Flagelloscypha sp. PMI_526]|nr:hypothetical protein DL96DRAFT_820627 [Flagelloscypha sp. PMI_526]
MEPGTWAVEYCKSDKCVCTLKRCKNGKTIPKGSLRLGAYQDFGHYGYYEWRHWACVDSVLLAKVNAATDGDPEEIDGFCLNLDPEDQEKVALALKTGTIDNQILTSMAEPIEPADAKNAKKTNIEKPKSHTKEGTENIEPDDSTKKRKRAPDTPIKNQKKIKNEVTSE